MRRLPQSTGQSRKRREEGRRRNRVSERNIPTLSKSFLKSQSIHLQSINALAHPLLLLVRTETPRVNPHRMLIIRTSQRPDGPKAPQATPDSIQSEKRTHMNEYQPEADRLVRSTNFYPENSESKNLPGDSNTFR
eukprot:1320515-Amorphochlora_amoeboformis.AAC.1